MSLPEPWVDKLFQKLSVTYGQSFMRQYDGVDPVDVKANWAHELSAFQQSPDAIRHGLEHLPPDRAPTVLQFKELCRRAPDSAFPRLAALPPPPSEPVDPVVAAAVRDALQAKSGRDPKQWARDLRDKEAAGAKLTLFQRQCFREALNPNETGPEAA